MFNTLYIRELQNYLYSLRFQVSFVITLLVFVIGSISFVVSIPETRSNYLKYEQQEEEKLEGLASNLTGLAIATRNFIFSPRSNSVIDDAKESYIPNRINYTAYGVSGFDNQSYDSNPLLSRTESLSWAFIVSMFFSFITLLFSFDSISGEKEEKTLSLVFSNSVSRGTFLFSKLAGVVSLTGIMLFAGMLVSLLILTFSGKVMINAEFLSSSLLFFFFSLLFITVFAVFGLLSSVITRNSNISLLISLCFWLFVVVFIPNTSMFWAKKVFPITSKESVEESIALKEDDLWKNAPPGSTSMHGGNPFYPEHELRAELYRKIFNMKREIMDDYHLQMFRQFENARKLTLISPVAQFGYMNEAAVAGGYLRFSQNWNNMQLFQEQYLQWFKDLDAKDEESPHWYNPTENLSTSQMEVSIGQIPRYKEQNISLAESFGFIGGYFIALVGMTGFLFLLSFYFFVRYDVR